MRRSADHERGKTPLTLRRLTVSLGVAVVFLGLAGVISLLAPIQVLNLRREEGNGIHADLTQRLLVFIPIRGKSLSSVTTVRIRTYAPAAYTKPDDPTAVVRPEEQSFLVLEGARGSTEISSSTVNVADAERSVREFLSGSDSQRRLWFVSNWKFGVVATGLVASLGIIILLGAVWDIIVWFARHRSEPEEVATGSRL
jgi:hypothetical protein